MSDKNRLNSTPETSIQITKNLLPPSPSPGSASPMSTSSYSSSGAALTPTSSTQTNSLSRLTTSLNTSTSSSISSSSSSSSSTNNLNHNNPSPNSTLSYNRHDIHNPHHPSHHGHRHLHNINSTNLNQELSLKNNSSSASSFLNSSFSPNLTSTNNSNSSPNSTPSTTPTNNTSSNQLVSVNSRQASHSSSSLLTVSTVTITNTSNNNNHNNNNNNNNNNNSNNNWQSQLEPLIGHGHFFTKKTFHKPTYCHHCTEMLWGLIGQGFVCEVCNFVCHEKCQKSVVTPCSSIAHSLIKNPVAHCWSEPTHFKRKFCNICRKRLEDNLSVRCEICEYFVHVDCQVLAVNDCCETATYVPNRNLKSLTARHHWREGNLPSNSKCVVCKKTCWTSECLAGMKCEWCGITTHGLCRQRIIDECNFGNLRDIIIPPYAVSVPRIEMNKETIFGLQNYRPKVRSNSTEWSSSGGDVKFDAVSDITTLTPPASQIAFNNFSSSFQTSQSLLIQSPLNNSISSPSGSLPASPFSNSQSKDNVQSVSSKKKEKYKLNEDETEDSRETIRVYDGNSSYRKKVFRTVTVQKNCSYQTLLESSLRTFHINDDSNKYYLSIPFTIPIQSSSLFDDFQIDEKLVDENNPIKNIKSAVLSSNFEGSKPSILLRYKDENIENIRIYAGIIKDTTGYQTVTITLNSTVGETIKNACEKFEINNDECDKYFLVQVLLDQDVAEKTLGLDEYPLKIIQQIRKESLCNNRMVRFYLQQKEDPHGSSVALFVGNLPNGLSQIQYEKILMDTLRNNNDLRWSKFDVIYYEYGSMVILYDDSTKAVKAFKMLKDSYYENKQLMVLLLPTIQPPMIPNNVCPLLVFVNVKSGGQQGSELITSFRHLLNPHQVFDLQNGGPLPGLYVFRNIESYRILACGGDGTIGWVLSCLDNVSQDAKCQSPPMAIVPLGTGNDLARVLRWGAGYTGAEEPINLLRDVIDAEEITLDRWTVVFHSDENKELDDLKRQLSIAVNVSQANTNEDNTEIYVMNNYFGIGIDADVCLDFHTAREENPNKFNSRLHNKKYYLQLGIRKMMNRGTCKDFNRYVTLEVDGRRVDLPQIEGIIILNILSWGSGANPWGPEKEDQFQKPTHYDGMLEVVGIKGVVHMGQIQSGLSGAIRLAQGGRIKIKMNTEIPVQVDGEPWLQPPCAITILKSALKATMLKKTKMKIKRRNTEPSVNITGVNQGPRAETDPVDPDGESEPF